MNAEKLYIENETTIDNYVKYVGRKNPRLDVEDVRGIANLIFMECVEKYTPEKGAFNAYLSSVLFYELQKRCKKESEYLRSVCPLSFDMTDNRQILDAAKIDVKNVVTLIMSELKKPTKRTIQKLLVNHGFTDKERRSIFSSLKEIYG